MNNTTYSIKKDEIERKCPLLDGMMEGNVIFSKGSTIVDCKMFKELRKKKKVKK